MICWVDFAIIIGKYNLHVPLISSMMGPSIKTVRRWKDFAPDIRVDWVRMAQGVLRFNVMIMGKFFNKWG